MDIASLQQYGPKIGFVLVGAGMLYLLRKFKKENDVAIWLRNIYATASKAATDEPFRQRELAAANAALAECPVPASVVPISRMKQFRVAMLPKFLFPLCGMGAILLYQGLFASFPAGYLYWGWGLLGLTLVLFLVSQKDLRDYARVQQLNRKYLLHKVGADPERFESLRQVMEYYPSLPELWLELSDQYAVDNRLDQALEAVGKARELAPDNPDILMVEASFRLRADASEAALKLIDEAEKLKTAASDPRFAIYRGAAALKNNEMEKAGEFCERALELDREFTGQLLEKDKTLVELAAFMRPMLAKEGEKGEDAAAQESGVESGEMEREKGAEA